MTWVCAPSASTAPRMVLPSMARALSRPPRSSFHCRRAASNPSGLTRISAPRMTVLPGGSLPWPKRGLKCDSAGSDPGPAPASPCSRACRRASHVLRLAEAIGKRAHLRGGECHFRNSLAQAGIKAGRPQPGPRIAAQRTEKDKLGPVMGDAAAALAAETPGLPGLEPVGCAADRAPAARRVDKGLRKQDPAAKAKRPAPRQTPRAQRQRPRAGVRLPAGRAGNRELSVTR